MKVEVSHHWFGLFISHFPSTDFEQKREKAFRKVIAEGYWGLRKLKGPKESWQRNWACRISGSSRAGHCFGACAIYLLFCRDHNNPHESFSLLCKWNYYLGTCDLFFPTALLPWSKGLKCFSSSSISWLFSLQLQELPVKPSCMAEHQLCPCLLHVPGRQNIRSTILWDCRATNTFPMDCVQNGSRK